VSDLDDIRQVIARYAVGLDERDFDAVASCFTPDAQATYNWVALDPGVDAIIAYVRALSQLEGSTHLMAEPLVTFDGDRAHSITSAIAVLAGGGAMGAPGVRIRGLVYEDDWVRVDGEWKIATRVHRPRWMTEGPILPIERPDPTN
jgi:hypothetical protein